MTNALLIIAVVLLLFLCGCMVLNTRYTYLLLQEEPEEQPEETIEAFVTSSNPAFTNENMAGQQESSIIVPKTPQRLAWEEDQELRKINMKPR
jgi:hypothetical protein